jgi:hypothetical protein
MVKITPEAERSEATIFCTATESSTLKWSKPFWTRYTIARSVKIEAKQRRHAASNASSPRTPR